MTDDKEKMETGGSALTGPEKRSILFRVLAILWIFPSLGAILIIVASRKRVAKDEGVAAGLASVPVEAWCAALLLGLHGLFFWLAWSSRKASHPSQRQPNVGGG